MTKSNDSPPILVNKAFNEPSIFLPDNLLREARRQKGLDEISVPRVCLLDPDGDIVRYLESTKRGRLHPGWACYHTEMWEVDLEGTSIGVVGLAVGAPFAVLVAEQLIASGASLIISVTSAGQILPVTDPPYFILIERALRDEGTSLHYQAPTTWSYLADRLKVPVLRSLQGLEEPVLAGDSWTTDAPYRETQSAFEAAAELKIACVEMESAALYAFASAGRHDVICFAHITNTLATTDTDFEKGEENGVHDALDLVVRTAQALAN
jgi:uridine phosphorylase